jgi:LemA protein
MGSGAILAIVIGFGVILIFWAIGIYNSLVRLRNEIENAWAQIDVQLKRRHDLIPNLLETVKGYAKHEAGTLEKVVQARNMATGATNVEDRMAAENMLSGALKSLFAVAEAYPDLKANTNFLALQEELTSTENKIAFSRQFFNDRTLEYNTKTETFPASVIAGMFSFVRKPFFEVKDEAVREVPKVSF